MADSPCLVAAIEQAARVFNRKFDQEDFKKVMNELNGRAEKNMQIGMERNDAYRKAGSDMVEEQMERYSETEKRLLTSLLKNEARYKQIDEAARDGNKSGIQDRIIRKLTEFSDASKRFSSKEGLSLYNYYQGEQDKAVGTLKTIFDDYLSKTGLKSYRKIDGTELANAILYAREQRALKEGMTVNHIKSTKPLNESMEHLGKSIDEARNYLLKAQNRYGAARKERADYITRNYWDRRKLMTGSQNILQRSKNAIEDRKAGTMENAKKISSTSMGAAKQEWLSDMTDHLDLDSTFPEIASYDRSGALSEQMKDALSRSYDNLTKKVGTPTYAIERDEEGKVRMYSQDRFLFGRSLHQRELHFKDAESYAAMAKKWFGMSPLEAISEDFGTLGKELGIMKWGGGAPEAAWMDLRKYVADNYKQSGISDKSLNRTEQRFRLGLGLVPVEDSVVSQMVEGAMTVQNFAKLGLVTPSSLPDAANLGTALMNYGSRNAFDLIRDQVLSIVRTYAPGSAEKDLDHVWSLLHVSADRESFAHTLNARAGNVSDIKGGLARANAEFFRWNLLHKHDVETYKTFIASTLRQGGIWSSREFNDLPITFQREMARFGIGFQEWEYYRGFISKDGQGRTYIDPSLFNPVNAEGIEHLADPLQKFNPAIKTEEDRLKTADDLYDRFTISLYDGMRQSILIPTLGTQYIMKSLGGLMPEGKPASGTMGSILRLMMQYRAFPIQTVRTQLSGVAAQGIKFNDWMPAVHYLASSMIYNYISWGAKNMLMLRTWPSLGDSKHPYGSFVENVLAPSFGMLQTLVLSEYSNSANLMNATFGPTGQSMTTMFSDMTKLARGDFGKSDALQLVQQWTPTTLPILGALWKHVLESFNSVASQRRSNDSLMDYSGNHYFWS